MITPGQHPFAICSLRIPCRLAVGHGSMASELDIIPTAPNGFWANPRMREREKNESGFWRIDFDTGLDPKSV
jgi:hypothetical protein